MDQWFATIIAIVLLAALASWFLLPMPWADLLLRAARRATGLRSATVRAGGLHWHYLDGGSGPALVMVHGFGATADHWLRMARQLRRQFRIIAPDLVGFGASEAGTSLPFDAGSQASRLGDLLDALGVDRCILAGSSMGGWVVTALAAADPGRARALWLQAPLGVRDSERSPFLAAADARNGLPDLSSRRDYETLVVREMFVRRPWFPHPLKVYFGADAVRRIEFAQRIFREVRQDSVPLEELASQVRVPVLLQWGDGDRVVDASGLATLQAVFLDVETHLQAGIGHLPMLESPRESLRLFLDFHRRRLAEGEHLP